MNHAAEVSVLYFGASWCTPCAGYATTFEQAARAQALAYRVVDVDEHPELTRRLRVSSLPSAVLLRNGVPVGRLVGVQSAGVLQKFLGHLTES